MGIIGEGILEMFDRERSMVSLTVEKRLGMEENRIINFKDKSRIDLCSEQKAWEMP